MFETWEIICLVIAGLLTVVLIYATYLDAKNKRKKPQDHYFADRKKEKQDDSM